MTLPFIQCRTCGTSFLRRSKLSNSCPDCNKRLRSLSRSTYRASVKGVCCQCGSSRLLYHGSPSCPDCNKKVRRMRTSLRTGFVGHRALLQEEKYSPELRALSYRYSCPVQFKYKDMSLDEVEADMKQIRGSVK